ncbi:MAG: hypothetical protein ACFCD0_18750 [Gemmataceae bacterium]
MLRNWDQHHGLRRGQCLGESLDPEESSSSGLKKQEVESSKSGGNGARHDVHHPSVKLIPKSVIPTMTLYKERRAADLRSAANLKRNYQTDVMGQKIRDVKQK